MYVPTIAVRTKGRYAGMFVAVVVCVLFALLSVCHSVLTEKELILDSGVTIKYYYRASPFGSTAKTVILLHGAKYSKETWIKTNTIFALAQHFNVYAIDIPNKKVDDSVLKYIIEKLRVVKPAIVSPSLSGKYSIYLLTHYPDFVSAYIAVAPVIPQINLAPLESLDVKSLFIYGDKDIEGIKRSR